MTEHVFAGAIVIVLLVLAGYFGWRQWQALRGLRHQADLPPEDQTYVRRQAWRRMVCSVLMVALAGLVAGWYLLGFNRWAVDLVDEAKGGAPLSDEQQRLLNWALAYMIAAVTILMAMLFLAAADLLAIRRFGIRHYRQIQADRRAMIENQVARLRSQRNGHG